MHTKKHVGKEKKEVGGCYLDGLCICTYRHSLFCSGPNANIINLIALHYTTLLIASVRSQLIVWVWGVYSCNCTGVLALGTLS
jgi:hypothetical protein